MEHLDYILSQQRDALTGTLDNVLNSCRNNLLNDAGTIADCLIQGGHLLVIAEPHYRLLAEALVADMLQNAQFDRPALPTVLLSSAIENSSAQLRSVARPGDCLCLLWSSRDRAHQQLCDTASNLELPLIVQPYDSLNTKTSPAVAPELLLLLIKCTVILVEERIFKIHGQQE